MRFCVYEFVYTHKYVDVGMHNIEEGLLGNDPFSRRVCSGPGAGTTREADKRIIAATFIDISEAKVTAPESAPIRTTDRRTDPVLVRPRGVHMSK